MTSEQKNKRIKELWGKARIFHLEVRAAARMQKKYESDIKGLMINDINDDQEEDNEVQTSAHLKVEWYQIHTESTFCKAWDFLIALVTIYTMFVTPYILIFPDVYS